MTKTYKGLMLLGILMIVLGRYFIAVALASKSWDQIEGKIINTRIPASLSNAGSTVEGGFNEKIEARNWLKNSDYSTGKKVTVYVKPGDPETSILRSGINIGTIAPILIGLLFFITGYVLNTKMPTMVKPV